MKDTNIHVGRNTHPTSLSRKIKSKFNSKAANVMIIAMGAKAANTTVKAIAILNKKKTDDYNYSFIPKLIEINKDEMVISALQFKCIRSRHDLSVSEEIRNKLNEYITNGRINV